MEDFKSYGCVQAFITLKDMEIYAQAFIHVKRYGKENVAMKKVKFNLQFFAEQEPAPASGQEQAQGEKQTDNPTDNPNGNQEENKASNKNDKKYSDTDLDNIINKKFAEWQKKKDEEIRQANLTAEEKEQERIKRLEELERTVAKNQADEKARQRLSEAKLPIEFAGFISDTQDDRAETKFKEFQAALTNYRESILKGVVKGDTPKQPKQSANQADNWRDRLTKNLKSIKEGE